MVNGGAAVVVVSVGEGVSVDTKMFMVILSIKKLWTTTLQPGLR